MGLLDDLEFLKKQRKPNLLANTRQLQRPAEPYLRQQYPEVYGALGGLLGMAPDEMDGSVLDPNTARVRAGAEYGFPVGTATQMLPMAKPAQATAMAAGQAGERLAERVVPRVMQRGGMGAEMLQGMSRGTVSPMDVYHGSPHKFDRFDASKIGTGEGAQAYGHGIYTAEDRGIADVYRKKLTGVDGAPISSPNDSLQMKIGRLQVEVDKLRQSGDSSAPAMIRAYEGRIKELNDVGSLYKVDLPDEQIAKMLDFDKPLSDQPKIMKALTPENMGLTLRQPTDGGFMAYVGINGKPIGVQVKGGTPEAFRQKWIDRLTEFGNAEGGAGRAVGYLGGTSTSGELAPAVSSALRQAGIPGIKYLDEGSRNLANTWIVRHPQGGENVFTSKASAEAYLKRNPEETLIEPKVTRNFVTFPGEEQSMTILERNGQPMVVRPQQQDAAPDLMQYQQMLDEEERKKLGGLLYR